jgi:predicted RNase H-like HicB family nuclease
MNSVKIVVWQEKDMWLGYVQEFPDYWTQGETLETLREHLKDLSSGAIPGARRVEELVIS